MNNNNDVVRWAVCVAIMLAYTLTHPDAWISLFAFAIFYPIYLMEVRNAIRSNATRDSQATR